MPCPNTFLYINLSLITNLAVWSVAPGSQMVEPKVQIKILAVDLDEAAPLVETTRALLGHRLEHLWSFVGEKNPKKHCRMLLFGHSISNIRLAGLGWVLSSHCCILHHYTMPLSFTPGRGKMLFLCQVNLDWSHVEPEVINYFHTV